MCRVLIKVRIYELWFCCFLEERDMGAILLIQVLDLMCV